MFRIIYGDFAFKPCNFIIFLPLLLHQIFFVYYFLIYTFAQLHATTRIRTHHK